jgi:hypothetical protein
MTMRAGIFAAVCIATALSASCSAGTRPAGDGELIGTATVALGAAPADGTCVQITVTGSARTVTHSFNVAVGALTQVTINGLPLGSDTFSAVAQGGRCPGDGGAPSWISDPVTAFVQATSPVPVSISLHRNNGGAAVTVDFDASAGSSGSQPGPGVCEAPTIPCVGPMGSGCFDATSDSNNCGSCGNTCASGVACIASVCAGPGDGSTGGSPDAGGGGGCQSASDCPIPSTICQIPSCTAGACGFVSAPAGQVCNDSGGTVCDGKGSCVQCLGSADCLAFNDAGILTCVNNLCQ